MPNQLRVRLFLIEGHPFRAFPIETKVKADSGECLLILRFPFSYCSYKSKASQHVAGISN